MSLSPEWRDRVNAWREELPRRFYVPLGQVDLEGFVTKDQLQVEEALNRSSRPMAPGTAWGAKWEYAWFRGKVVLPEQAAGRRIVLRVDTGGESAIDVNGVAVGARDAQHAEITLAHQGVPGAEYEIAIESYAGHGPRVWRVGPTPPDRETVPEPPSDQCVVGTTTYGVWLEEVYQLYIDVQTLYDLRENLDPDSLRVAEIDAGLREMTLVVDPELGVEAFLDTVQQGRERLAALLACENGSTAPTLYAFGHSHIDVAWLWPLQETERKCVRTFATQLALAEEYPEYRFLQSQPHLYWMLKQRYPRLYERVRRAARQGQIMPEGGMWVEADTNLSGGESLIRQFLYGKRFFRDELGVDCELLWLPDVFGYSGALPQIMRGCGIKYFATAKIFWAYHGKQPFPYNTFTWEGIDGSEVKVHLVNDYNSRTDMATLIERWRGRVQKDGIATRLVPFGYGDGGGGPTRDHLEYLRRARNLEGVPKVVMANPIDYFRDQEARGWPSERFVGELYFQAHRGTYTSQGRTKRGNRKSEVAIHEAEMWSAIARAVAGREYPVGALEDAWRAVLLNQFHDIIPGSSIHRVYEEAEKAYEETIASANELTDRALSDLVQAEKAVTVFNSLNWPRKVLVPIPESWEGAQDADGAALAVQGNGDDALAEVQVPACGWTSIRPGGRAEEPSDLNVGERVLENAYLCVELDDLGRLVSVLDKETNRELAAAPCNDFRMYKDVPSVFDAWDLDSVYSESPVPLDSPARIAVVASGSLYGEIRVERRLHDSTMTQTIRLRRRSRRVEFATEIDWQERHKMLKVAFPVVVRASEAIHEIQFGNIRRPTHRSMPFDADRYEVCNHRWTALAEPGYGCAVLNDCKYGVDVLGSTISLTLLKSALGPDMTADRGRQTFTYAFSAWDGDWLTSDVVKQGYDLNYPVVSCAGAGESTSLFAVEGDSIVLETVKCSEDGAGDVIVRLYESKGTHTRGVLTTVLPVIDAEETNMLEDPLRGLGVTDSSVGLEFTPFEIKTVRLRLG